MLEFHRIAAVIRDWPRSPIDPDTFHDPQIRRLARVLEGDRKRIDAGDLCGLIRSIMRRVSCRTKEVVPLLIPETAPFPDNEAFRAHGFTVLLHGPGLRRVEVEPWRPIWAQGKVVDEWVYGDLPPLATDTLGVRADPAVRRLLDFQEFATPGQAGAVRAAMLLDGEVPLLVNLPTGAGKSLAFQVLALVGAERGGTTVIVVPTVALALDQERRFLELGGLRGPLAFHSGLSAAARAEFRRDLRTGAKKVVITSPEAALGSLLSSISDLAAHGGLAGLVIDEAHLVSGWGAEFRPEFQMLGALQRHLRSVHSPRSLFRTILLSATITKHTREDLAAVFGPMREVAAVELRREPEYWVAHSDSVEARNHRVLEAVMHLPRPCIVYTSKREDASELYHLIRREGGIERTALVRGGDLTSVGGGSAVIGEWERGNLDVIVATAAFGLGVDNREVRTIIHACVPESVDRFYQELGRAGRDGCPSISLLLWCDADVDVARSLARERYIGDEKGWGHWWAMYTNRKAHPTDPELVGLPIDRVPPWLIQQSDENRAWNLRTLNLMQRAGMLWLEVDGQATDSAEEVAGRLRPRFVWARIRSPVGANSETEWCRQVGPVRNELRESAAKELQRVLEDLLPCKKHFADLFALPYEFGPTRIGRETGPDPVTRALACGPVSPSVRPCPVLFGPSPLFSSRIPGAIPGTVVEIPETWQTDDTVSLILELISRGFVDVAIPETGLDHRLLAECDQKSPNGYVALRNLAHRCGIERFTGRVDFQVAGRIVYLPETFPAPRARALIDRLRRGGLPSFVLVESTLSEGEAPFRPLLSVLDGPRIRAENLLHRLRHGTSEPHQ